MSELSEEHVIEAVEKTDFHGRGLHPNTANCTAVAVGITRVLPTNDCTVVSVYDVDGLVHSVVNFRGSMIDSRGKLGDGKERLFSFTNDFTMEDLDAALYSGTVEEFILEHYIEEYNEEDLKNINYSNRVANEAENLFRESFNTVTTK